MAEEGGSGQLFQGVTIAFAPDQELVPAELAEELIDLVQNNGGHYISEDRNDKLLETFDEVTHLISTHIDFPQYHAALENGVNVVKPSWLIQSAAKGKIAQLRPHSPDPSQYFQNVVVTTASLPEGDKDAIIAGVIALGGQYSGVLSKLVTHIVTLDETHEKCRTAKEKLLNSKVVLPHWFDDCFKLGKKIGEAPYSFPDPEILKPQHDTKIRDIPSSHLDGAILHKPMEMPEITSASSPSLTRKNLSALAGQKVFLSHDLQLNAHLVKTLDDLINSSDAKTTSDIDEATIYIGHRREGKEYASASRSGIVVANLSWLYHVINRNKYTNPLNKLLHYPIPADGIPGFENMRISVSNYTGDARIYLENLIKCCGAEFTKTMKADNTHLITAHMQSEKVEAAQEWGLHIVNHIWLEESYAKCAVQTLTNQRYLCFPARTNLGEVTGQTSFDMKRLERLYFPPSSPKRTSPSRPSPSKISKTPRKNKESASTSTDAITTTNTEILPPTANTDNRRVPPQPVQKPRGRLAKAVSTPRVRDEEKENRSPLLGSSGRASKVKALGMLHGQADDIALFNKEMKRKGGVTHGGRASHRSELVSSPAPKQSKKRKSDEATYNATPESSDPSDDETKGAQRSKKARHASELNTLPPIKYKMMVSGDERWLKDTNKESKDRMKLRQLGIQLTQDPKLVDILVAPRILRTRKFVAALACAPLVVDTQYLDDALKYSKIPEKPKLLIDRDTEEENGFKLTEALERASINRGKLFRGWSIFVTKDIKGSFDTFKEIIHLNGGTALMYQGRTGLSLPRRRLREDPEAGSESQHQGGDDEFDYVYLVSGATEVESKLWKSFLLVAKKQSLKARIVDKDWVLNAAMSQRIKWNEKWELAKSDVE